jgi:hypothetical protein
MPPAKRETNRLHTSACADGDDVKRSEGAEYIESEAYDEMSVEARREPRLTSALGSHVVDAPDFCTTPVKLRKEQKHLPSSCPNHANPTQPCNESLAWRSLMTSEDNRHNRSAKRPHLAPRNPRLVYCEAQLQILKQLADASTTHQYGVIDRSTLGSRALGNRIASDEEAQSQSHRRSPGERVLMKHICGCRRPFLLLGIGSIGL